MKKKIFLISVLLLFIIIMLSNSAFADTEIGYWTDEGNYDYNWYVNDDDYKSETGDGNFYITNAMELAGLSAITNEIVNVDLTKLEGKTVIINDNIDLADHYWVPIRNLNNVTLDGNYKTISNINSVEEMGFIDTIENCYIKNMNVTCIYDIKEYENGLRGGGFVNSSYYSTLDNISIDADIKVLLDYNQEEWGKRVKLGGLVGYMENGVGGPRTIKNCTVNGKLNANIWNTSGVFLGGVVGELEGDRVVNTSSNINIELNCSRATSYGINVGGIAGGNIMWNTLEYGVLNMGLVINSYNTGNINVNLERDKVYTEVNIGGIVGDMGYIILNTYNSGRIYVQSDEYVEIYIGAITGDEYGLFANNFFENEIECEGTYTNISEGIRGIDIEKLNDALNFAEYIYPNLNDRNLELKKWIINENENNGFPVFSDEYLDIDYSKLNKITRIDISFDENIIGKNQNDLEISYKHDYNEGIIDYIWIEEYNDEFDYWDSCNEASRFEEGELYRIGMSIARDAGCVFDDNIEIYINNKKVEASSIGRNSINIEYVISTSKIKGDINNDGKLTLYDAFTILRKVITSESFTEDEIYIMDYNDDRNVTLYDAFSFLRQVILD